jgi:hypothetical protein
MTLERLGGGQEEVVPIPHDCLDGFFHAYWRRPEAYLAPASCWDLGVYGSGEWMAIRGVSCSMARIGHLGRTVDLLNAVVRVSGRLTLVVHNRD